MSPAGARPYEGELRGDVFGGELAAAQAGVAAFEEVVGDELVLLADVVGADGGFDCGDGAEGDVRCGRGARLEGIRADAA